MLDANLRRMMDMYESMGIPKQEALNLAMKQYETGELGEAEELGASGMDSLTTDPEVLAQQKQALSRMAELGEAGVTPEEEAERNKLMRSIASQEQANQKSIAQDFASRGAGGSGIELATRLSSSQSSAQRGAESAEALEAEKYRRALEGVAQSGTMAGQFRSQEFSEGAAKASAADAIAQFNLQNRAKVQDANLARQRQVTDANTQMQNQKEQTEKQYTAGQSQQDFQNKMAIANAKSGIYQADSQAKAQQEAARAAAEAQSDSSTLGFVGDIIGAGAKLAPTIMASDERVKINVEDGSDKIDEMMENISPKSYDYTDPEKYGEGNHVGVMAQDLENSELGDTFVQEDEEGTKVVNYGKMAPTILASQTKQHEELKEVKSKLARLEEMLLKYRS